MRAWLTSAMALVVIALGLAGCVGDEGSADLGGLKSFNGYEVYYAGAEAEGAPLSQVARREDPRGDGASDDWTFAYGDCEPTGDGGSCGPPVEVQNFPACHRPAAGNSRPLKFFDFRGARATWLGEADLDIYAGNTAIAIFASDRRAALRVGRELRTVKQTSASGDLPAPTKGSLRNEPECPTGSG